MPLTDDQKLDLMKLAAQERIGAVAKVVAKLQAVAPPAGDPEGRHYLAAIGVLWYGLLGGLRVKKGEREALVADLDANLIAGFMLPDLVDLQAAIRRALDYKQMADPAAKG